MGDILLDSQFSNGNLRKKPEKLNDVDDLKDRYTCEIVDLEHHEALLINRMNLGHVDNQDLI